MPDIRMNRVSCKNYTKELEITVEFLSGKWIAIIISHLGEKEVVRFNEFRKVFPDITQKVLSQQLKKLEGYKIIEKKIFSEIPPKVEYRLTSEGKSLLPILEQMQNWGKNYLTKYY